MSYDVSKLRVLIVDDSPHLRRLLWTILRSFGVEALAEADEGGSGMVELQNFKPNVVFVDWGMSPMNGVEMVRRIRLSDNDLYRFVPIVMMSGHPALSRIIQARDAGATEFLAKPITAKIVLDRLVAVIEKPRDFVRTKSFFGPDRRRRTWTVYTGEERRGSAPEAEAKTETETLMPPLGSDMENSDLVLRPVAESAENQAQGELA
jgi:DNA-binding response OmpR family regulator